MKIFSSFNEQNFGPVHLKISQIILNYGQWFTFIYNTNKSVVDPRIEHELIRSFLDFDRSTEMDICLYEIYNSHHRDRIIECADENIIQIKLEEHLRNRTLSVKSYQDLMFVNTFPKLLPSLYFITNDSSESSIDEPMKMIHVDM